MVALNGWQVTNVNGESAGIDAGLISAPLGQPPATPVPSVSWPSNDDDGWGDPAADEARREQSRLQSEIAAAKARVAAAQHLAASRDAEARAVLRDALAASRQELAEIERDHEAAVSMIREAAALEVERILESARAEARIILADEAEATDE